MKPTFPFACLGLLLCWSASSPEIRAAASPSTVIGAAGAAEPKTAIRNTRPIAAFPAVRTAAPDSGLLTATWETRWARDGESSPYDFGVYHFRRSFDLAARPETFVINITADNRYRLFVNGTPACWGSARGDLRSWYYETVDIAPLLHAGRNTLAVQVWNGGELKPQAQVSFMSGLLVQGNTEAESAVNTPGEWKVFRNEAIAPTPVSYVGFFEQIDGNRYPWGWEQPGYDDSSWHAVRAEGEGIPFGHSIYGGYQRALVPRQIPLMEETPLRIPQIRRSEGLARVSDFISGCDPLQIPARTTCSILLDQTFLTNAYPELILSGGKGATVRLAYGEALFDSHKQKGNRNEIDGRTIELTHYDIVRPDGAEGRLYRPVWFRTYRYIQLDITTAGDPLTIEDLYGRFTGYPFTERGSFSCDDPGLAKIWEVGWRTARLCAMETYFDCPYYEQLQYVGDTRIQALISLYVSGDDRLMRQAIRAFDLSRSPEGITASRYPNLQMQYIPPFSLYWINMVHDYWMHRDDEAFVRQFLPGIRSVLEWYVGQIDPATGMLRSRMPHWSFVDWVRAWWVPERPGCPPEGEKAGSSIITLNLSSAMRDGAELLARFGDRAGAARYDSIGRQLAATTYEQCWDEQRGMLHDYIGSPTFSQHANIMGILTDAIPAEQQQEVFNRIDSDTTISQATFYYRFYLTRALKKTGLADRYSSMLQPWYDMIDMGLSTFAENPEPTRSDCHAWSSSPNYDFLTTILGVEPDAPGFASVRIEPHPGHLNRISGVVPHPQGDIRVELRRTQPGNRNSGGRNSTVSGHGGLRGEVTLPGTLTGRFVWNGREIALSPGLNNINI